MFSVSRKRIIHAIIHMMEVCQTRRKKLAARRTAIKKQLFGLSQDPKGKVREWLAIAIVAMREGRKVSMSNARR